MTLSEPTSAIDLVIDETRTLALEAGGERAARAVNATASLEREVGLGSLEKVELVTRLERRAGRALPDDALQSDSCEDLARALGSVAVAAGHSLPQPEFPNSGISDRRDIGTYEATVDRALAARTEETPDQPTVLLTEDDGAERTITYRALFDGAAAIAAGLSARGVTQGDTIALMLPTGFDFLRSFQGILLRGAVAVPIYPPLRLDRLAEYAERQSAILKSAGVRLLITIPRAKPIGDVLKAMVPTLEAVLSADEVAASASGRARATPQSRADDAAFIQYTSGSTGSPKGVLLTHANLMANIKAISRGLEARATEVGVSWLPLYHDMGLIGSWLFPMASGFPLALRSPLSFLARPERWLHDIHRRRGTLSAAPNFAYELCVRRIRDEDIAGIDLSSWMCALNGAEPVRPETMDRFVQRFSKYGFRREAMMPVYGLAENSVGLAVPPVGRGPKIDRVDRASFEQGSAAPAAPGDPSASMFVCVGRALPEHEIRIVDDSGATLPERRVGRLLFRGPSMTAGYYRNEAASQAIRGPEGFLDSGDLAYFADGELYIAGRLKDLIIRGGRNFVASEIEEAAASVAGVRQGCVAAFGLIDPKTGTEQIVVVAETRARSQSERDALEGAVIERVSSAIGAPPDIVRLAPPGAIPKTSSGKIRRNDTRMLFESGALGRSKGDTFGKRIGMAALIVRSFGETQWNRVRLALRAVKLYGALTAFAPVVKVVLPFVDQDGSRRFERFAARIATRLLTPVATISNLPMLSPGQPALLVCNHASYIDVIFLRALLPSDLVFVSKREGLGYPLVGDLLRRSGHICVERKDAQKSAADAAQLTEALSRGEHVLVFPEGTFTAAEGLRPFRLGAFQAAAELKCPVIPMALRGTRRMLRDGQYVPRTGEIALEVFEPLVPSGQSFRDLVAFRDKVREIIGKGAREAILETAPPIKETV